MSAKGATRIDLVVFRSRLRHPENVNHGGAEQDTALPVVRLLQLGPPEQGPSCVEFVLLVWRELSMILLHFRQKSPLDAKAAFAFP